MAQNQLRPAAADTADRGAGDARLTSERHQPTSNRHGEESRPSDPSPKIPTRDDLIRKGFAVFPCQADKSPATPHGFKDAVSDIDAANDLWRRYPGPLTGIATGAVSNLAVLDIDPGGRMWWDQNARRLPMTEMIRTRRGGLHLRYMHSLGLKCSAGQITPGVDVRADGGYAIAWDVAGLPVLRTGPPASWPDWLAPTRKKSGASRGGQAGPEPARMPTDRLLIGLVKIVVGAPEGQRNSRLFWAACRMAGLIRGGFPRAEGLDLLMRAALIVGLDEDEAIQTAERGLAVGGAS